MFTNVITGDLLTLLAKHHEAIAFELFEMKHLHYKLSNDNIVQLCTQCTAFSACYVALACFESLLSYHRYDDGFEIYSAYDDSLQNIEMNKADISTNTGYTP